MKTTIRAFATAGVLAWGLTGCLSMQSQSTLDGIQEGAMGSNQPYVEGYIEYAGPHARWAGPSSFILHVVAKDAGPAQIAVTPALFNEMMPTPGAAKARVPASQGMPGEMAREQLAHLATSLQGADQTFKGCLSPLRVRLIRADGSLLEKMGCRGQSGWAHTASQSVSNFITASLYGTAQRTPASVTPPKIEEPKAVSEK